MKISILLPYKENFSPEYPGAVSLFVNDTTKISKFRNNIYVFGNTNYKKIFNFTNKQIIPFKTFKKIFFFIFKPLSINKIFFFGGSNIETDFIN